MKIKQQILYLGTVFPPLEKKGKTGGSATRERAAANDEMGSEYRSQSLECDSEEGVMC